ncbi:RICIN domain-containing protein [Plantactinospora sp. WMMB334]|uniref:RICIN domain-containing protein n=1 Tax=Plantactinospora sp. WMMB334 TaxID=3404119 RepID=UPI003B93D038
MTRHIKVILAVLAAATLAVLGTPAPASANGVGTSVADEVVTFTNLNSNKCLTIAGGSTANLARAVQYNCDGHPSRLWLIDGSLTGNFRIVNVNSGRCLTIDGGSTANIAPAVQYTCDTHRARYWTAVNATTSSVQIRNLNSGKCLTIDGGSTANNAPVVQYNCDTHPSRRWY